MQASTSVTPPSANAGIPNPGLERIASKIQRFANLWTLYYRHGMNAGLYKNFYCEGNLQTAIKRAQLHCQIMNYKYIWVRPLVCDIESEEEYKLRGANPEEGY
jgi:hypothetical protein